MIQYLNQYSPQELIQNEEKNTQVRRILSQMSVGLTIEKAITAPKIFQVRKTLGEETLVKILTVIIHSFVFSLKVKDKMDALEIISCARVLAGKYTHDSIKDIILALKEAKEQGKVFYNAVSEQVIYQIVNEYMERKSAFIENYHREIISQNDGSVRTEAGTIAAIEERRLLEQEKKHESKAMRELKNKEIELKRIENFIKKNVDKLD